MFASSSSLFHFSTDGLQTISTGTYAANGMGSDSLAFLFDRIRQRRHAERRQRHGNPHYHGNHVLRSRAISDRRLHPTPMAANYTFNYVAGTLTVQQAPPVITLAVPAVANRGTAASLTATFTVASGSPAPVNSIEFDSGTTVLGFAALVQTSATTYAATLSSFTLPSGSLSFTAQYPGDSNNYPQTISSPQPIFVIANDIWLGDSNGTIAAMGATGIPYLSSAETSGGTGVAIDGSGDVWSLNANTLSEFSNTGSVLSSGFSGGGLSTPTSLIVDGAGQVWITNTTNSISVFGNTGTPVSATAYTGGNMNAPASVSVDTSGNLWIANSGNSSITEVLGAAAPTVPLAVGVANNTTGGKP